MAPLPITLDGPEKAIAAVLAPIPELTSGLYLVTRADLPHNPRVRAFCDFMAAEVARNPQLGTWKWTKGFTLGYVEPGA